MYVLCCCSTFHQSDVVICDGVCGFGRKNNIYNNLFLKIIKMMGNTKCNECGARSPR